MEGVLDLSDHISECLRSEIKQQQQNIQIQVRRRNGMNNVCFSDRENSMA